MLNDQLSYDFASNIPRICYATSNLNDGIWKHSRSQALAEPYLQFNHANLIKYVVFDLDYEGAVLAWYDNNLPPPLWTSKNPKNGHAHICYKLAVPVCSSDLAHADPLKYLAAIQSAFTSRLKADGAYVGLICKNPLHSRWQTTWWSDTAYTLDELADYVDLRGHPAKHEAATGLGRNCDTFFSVRKWAYKTIRDYWQPNYYRLWSKAVLARVEAQNQIYAQPLANSEVKSIARSVAKWTYREFTPEKFSASQAKKGAKGGKISKGGGRPTKKADLLPIVHQMLSQGYNQAAIAEDLGITTRTIRNWIK